MLVSGGHRFDDRVRPLIENVSPFIKPRARATQRILGEPDVDPLSSISNDLIWIRDEPRRDRQVIPKGTPLLRGEVIRGRTQRSKGDAAVSAAHRGGEFPPLAEVDYMLTGAPENLGCLSSAEHAFHALTVWLDAAKHNDAMRRRPASTELKYGISPPHAAASGQRQVRAPSVRRAATAFAAPVGGDPLTSDSIDRPLIRSVGEMEVAVEKEPQAHRSV